MTEPENPDYDAWREAWNRGSAARSRRIPEPEIAERAWVNAKNLPADKHGAAIRADRLQQLQAALWANLVAAGRLE